MASIVSNKSNERNGMSPHARRMKNLERQQKRLETAAAAALKQQQEIRAKRDSDCSGGVQLGAGALAHAHKSGSDGNGNSNGNRNGNEKTLSSTLQHIVNEKSSRQQQWQQDNPVEKHHDSVVV